LLGGGFLAVSGLLVIAVTIIRLQKGLVIGYALVSAAAFILSPQAVARYSMPGASVLYLLLVIVLCLLFTLILGYGIIRGKKRPEGI
jgi:ribose/xylose/arabinose/galactoside ABC-type transport system permease subunit